MLTFNALLWTPQEAGIGNVIVPKKYIFFNYLENCKTYQGKCIECYMCFTVLYKLSVIRVSLFCTIWVLCVVHSSVQIECYVWFTVLYKLSVICGSLFCTNWALYVFHCSVQIECYVCFTVLYTGQVPENGRYWNSQFPLVWDKSILSPLPPSTDITGQIPSTQPM
jgi:hypothetical protein